MCDSQMKNIGQIQPARKPAKDKINSAYQHSSPRSQMSWGGKHASEHVEENNQIASDIVNFHEDSVGLFKQKLELLSNYMLNSKRLIICSLLLVTSSLDVHE